MNITIPTYDEYLIEEAVNEAKMTASKFVKMIRTDEENWGDLGEFMKASKGNLEVVDTFYYGEEAAMNKIEKDWSPGGIYYDYFKKELGIEFQILDTYSYLKAPKGWLRKLTTDGIVGLILKIK